MSRKVLITSIGRTATLSLTQWMNQFPGVQAYHERGKDDPYFLYLSQFDAYAHFTEHYLNQRDALALKSGSDTYLEVNPYFRFANQDHLKKLGWSTVFIVRHPRTYLTSVYRRKLFTAADTSFQKLPESNDLMYSEWDRSSRFQKLCWYYAQVHQYILNGQYTFFQSETLVEDRAVQEEFLKAIGLDQISEIPNFPHLNQSHKSTLTHQLDWDSLSADDMKTYTDLCTPLIAKLGYELS
ncbi:hypothetical protein [Gilvibacter sp.]|uniref:hypothetical protein n=1 Tax=Gilvibacter sp. TaxID=2729997 RepID=UPI003F4A5D26